MDLFHYTFLKNHQYLDKFRNALNAPSLTLSCLNALLKTFNANHKLHGFLVPDDRGVPCLYYKDTLNQILMRKDLINELNMYLEEWDYRDYQRSQPAKTWDDTPEEIEDTNMEKVSNKLIWNDNYRKVDENKKMGRKIHITESQFRHIMEANGKYFVDTDKVKVVSKYLDENFLRGNIACMGEDGYPTSIAIVAMKGVDGKPIKNMDAKQLFYLLQDKFQKIYDDKKQRDNFLKQIIKDWFYHKISKEGLLSVNVY